MFLILPVTGLEGGTCQGALLGPPWEIAGMWRFFPWEKGVAYLCNVKKEVAAFPEKGGYVSDVGQGEFSEIRYPSILFGDINNPTRGPGPGFRRH
jgi:hypothetical protein